MRFKDTFLDLLKERGFTYSAIAREIGKPPSTVRMWVDRDVVPSGDLLYELSCVLDVSMEFLVTGEEKREVYSREEKKLIADFRTLEEPDKTEILFLIDLKKKKLSSFSDNKTDYFPV